MGDRNRSRSRARGRLRRWLPRLLAAAALGAAAALLVSCGSSTGKLIPAADAGPLQSDFEAVAGAAQSGNGNCSETEAAILKTEHDFAVLPSSVDAGLRSTLRQGITNLRKHALELCRQPLSQPTTTTTAPKTTSTRSTPTTTTETQTTTTQTTPTTTPTTPTTSGPGGGTPAEEQKPAPEGGGTKPAEGGNGPGGQEGGK
ncbi:MAG TPA: hypothetical protein VGN08_05540 [Solirubrobacteraceae bacterium]|jgi:hypothetical protein